MLHIACDRLWVLQDMNTKSCGLFCQSVIRYILLHAVVLVGYSHSTITTSTVSAGVMQMSGRHIRSPLARSVYTRLLEDQRHRDNNHHYWYALDVSKLSSELCAKFLQCHQDEETSAFLNTCYDKADQVWLQLYHSVAKGILSWFMSTTSVNGLLQRGSMFVFSEQQFLSLLGESPSWKAESLLDLGAGDGKVTQKMAPHFDRVFVTEMSSTMVWRLQEHGFEVLDVDAWDDGSRQYDLIACLNLLDRCAKPRSLLQSMHRSLRPGTGRAVVAVVLPFSPFVEFETGDHQPVERLRVLGASVEEQIASMVRDVFIPAGFELQSFARLPYLCEGDLSHSFYVLQDVVFVLKPQTA